MDRSDICTECDEYCESCDKLKNDNYQLRCRLKSLVFHFKDLQNKFENLSVYTNTVAETIEDMLREGENVKREEKE